MHIVFGRTIEETNSTGKQVKSHCIAHVIIISHVLGVSFVF